MSNAEHQPPNDPVSARPPMVLRRASDRTPLGSIIGSIERAFDLGDYDLLAELLDRNILAAWFGLRPERLGLIIATMTEAGAPVNLVLRTIATLLASPGSAHAIGEQLSDSAPEAGTLDELAALSQRMFALRLQGCPVEAMQFSASLDRRSGISYPLFDTQNGWGLFAPVQFGLTAMLAGDFSAALASFTQARMHVIVPHLAFLTRDAYVKSALIEALYGDAERASALLDDASRVLRTESWAEGGLDACAVIAGSLLPSRAPAEALRMLESVPLHEVGEMWPFHAAAVHRALVAAGYQEEARRRIEMFEGMPLPHQEGQGYTGSVLLLCRIADSVAHGDLLDARERIGRADESIAVTRLVAARLELAAGRPRESLRWVEGLHEQTGGLRSLEVQRLAVIAGCHLALGSADECREVLELAARLPGGLSPHEAQYFPADVHRFAGAGVGAWPFAEQPGSDDYEMFPTGVPLTARELDVLQQLSGGHSRGQIAQSQYISLNTLKAHLRSIYRKLGVSSRAGAVIEAERRGII